MMLGAALDLEYFGAISPTSTKSFEWMLLDRRKVPLEGLDARILYSKLIQGL